MSGSRPWFRFHLLTAVLVTIALSILCKLMLDLRPQCFPPGNVQCYERGWPVVMNQVKDEFETRLEWKQRHYDWNANSTYSGGPPTGLQGEWNVSGMLVNAVSGVLIVSAVAALSEYTLRRRGERKP